MNIPEVNIVGVLTATREFRISYSKNEPVKNVLYTDFHKTINNKNSFPILTMKNSMKDPGVVKFVKNSAPDLVLVVGWYHMIPKIIRSIPSEGIIGIHASLLPKYRGGAPLVWAIINGERVAGITLFYFDEGVDSGDIIGQRKIHIGFEDTIFTVYKKAEKEGISLLRDMIPRIAVGNAPRSPQGERKGKIWPQRKPEDGKIIWSSPTQSIYNFVRAQTKPYPGAFTLHRGERLTIWEAKPYDRMGLESDPGQVLDIINNKIVRGIVISSEEEGRPLLITKVGTKEIEIENAYDYAKRVNLVIGEMVA